MEQIRISVRNLVEFILQSGDIDNRRGSMADKEAMQIGSRLHRKIQGQMGAAYRAEVSLKQVIDCQEYSISVEGRADGIFTEDGQYFIDEIKGIARDVARMEEPVPVHLAQAKCYACIYAQQENLEQIGVQMTYVNLDTEEIRRIRKEYTQTELKEWFDEIIEKYKKWASFQVAWKHTRRESIKPVTFPYPYRDGQKELAGAVYRTIAREKKLFIQAPTGVGKTMATVFPAVKAVGEGIGEKIFYLTAKTITRTVAQEAFALLKKQELQYKVVTLTAKEKLCICEEPDCNPVSCPYAKGHYDRINDAVFELLTGICGHEPPDAEKETPDSNDAAFAQESMFVKEMAEEAEQKTEFRRSSLTEEEYLCERKNGNYTREVILAHAQRWKVCPFELSLDLSLWVDAIICDYNYVFDPQAKLKRFFADGVKGDYIFLIDEAHNLVERGREMYSAALYKEDFLEIKRLLKPYSKKAERTLEKCNKYLLEMKRECESYQLLNDIGPFAIALMNVSSQLETLLEEQESVLNRPGSDPKLRKTVLEFYFQIRSFLGVYEELDDSYQIYTEQEADGRFKLKLYCISPAGRIGDCLTKGRGTVLFSATLLPVRYYMELLSGTEEDYAVYAKSTFDPTKKKLLIGADVSSRYTRRGEAEYRRIARYIEEMLHAQEGNYLVFFPSYKMMEEVREIFESECRLPVKILMQNSRMTENQREEFLEEFRFTKEKMDAQQESLLGFCVMGGIFGEGIDLKRDQLIGAAVVGTGLPQICNEREILKQYYDKRSEDGFAYAYQYPGMNKVMQSAGRVIRTDEDRGVILLLDERFCQWQYRSIFPREWADYEICSLQNVREKLRGFWE